MRAQPAETCLLCGSAGVRIHAAMSDQLFDAIGEWSVRRCSSAGCGLAWLDPKPLPDDLHLAYSHYYTHSDAGSGSAPFKGPARRLVRRLERVWLAVLGLRRARQDIEVLFLDGRTPGKVLEVGCGDGARLVTMQQLGWTVEGQEVDSVSAAQARGRGFPVHLGTLEELGLARRVLRRRRDESRAGAPSRPGRSARPVSTPPQTRRSVRRHDAEHPQLRPRQVRARLDRPRRASPPAPVQPGRGRPFGGTSRLQPLAGVLQSRQGRRLAGGQSRDRPGGSPDAGPHVGLSRTQRPLVSADGSDRLRPPRRLR